MKTMRKVLSMLLVLAMLLSLGAMAVSAAPGDGKVTVTDPQPGEEYKLYKLFDLIYDQPDTPTKFAYTYTTVDATQDEFLTALQTQESPFTLTLTSTDKVYNVALKGNKTAEDVVTFLKANAKDLPDPVAATTAQDRNALVFDGLAYGYYYLTSTLGTLVTLDSNTPNVDVQDKNEVPTLTKQVQENSNQTWGKENTASMGDDVKFQITLTAKTGAQNYVVHDTLPAGLTYNSDPVVSVNGQPLTPTTDYTVSDKGQNITVQFTQDYLDKITANTDIVITYSAKLNHSAVVGAPGNVNTAWMTYGKTGKTTDEVTTTYTYGFDLVKTDAAKKLLNGATFKLYDALTDGNEVKLIKQDNGNYYRVVGQETAAEVIDMTSNAKVRIEGLDNGIYYLEEIQAPAGYNKLNQRVKVEIMDGNLDATLNDLGDTYVSGGVQVENQTGAELPGTGGMGTTVFYVLGAILVLGAAVLLVAKRRVREK